MAELLIPALAIGGLYKLVSDNKKEGFGNIPRKGNRRFSSLDNTLPKSKVPIPRVKPIINPTTPFDNLSKKTTKHLAKAGVRGLTGTVIDPNEFNHNNMVPYFGARIKGPSIERGANASVLDSKAGSGTFLRHKKESAPLFKPQKKMNWANGMPVMTEFLRSRENPSTRASNVKPWDEVKVAPGLGLGYTTGNDDLGYNNVVNSRQSWLPKTVNQLRTTSNPKQTHGLAGFEGAAHAYNKVGSTKKTIGKIEKNRPNTDYELGPSRWFTTVGATTASSARSEHILSDQHRQEGGREYYGSSGAKTGNSYMKGEFRLASRQALGAPLPGAPSSVGAGTDNDHGQSSHENVVTNRGTIKQTDHRGPVSGMVEAIMAPVIDALRPSKKGNVVGSIRPCGNVGGTVSQPQLYDPNDRTQTTIREQTESLLDNNHLNVQAAKDGAYMVNSPILNAQHRDTTNRETCGSAGPSNYSEMTDYSQAYNQQTKHDRTAAGRINSGTSASFNGEINMELNPERIASSYVSGPSGRISAITGPPALQTQNRLSQKAVAYSEGDRMDPAMLDAFRKNPFTHSLSSAA